MAKVALYNMEGTKTGDMEVSDAIFAAEVNKSVLHQVVVNYLANQRQGTQSTKTRTEVRGGGIKPWRQKGTGRARQGSIRAPQWTGGGVALGPKPRSYRFSVNKKIKRIALKSALSAKYADYKIFVIDELAVDEIKTAKTLIQRLLSLQQMLMKRFINQQETLRVLHRLMLVHLTHMTFLTTMHSSFQRMPLQRLRRCLHNEFI